MQLSHTQLKALAILPKVTGGLSVCFSTASIVYVLKSNGGRNKFFHQLIWSMGIIDIVSSLSYAMSTWGIPEESGALYAVGNDATCQAQGFFIQVGIASPLYNCSLGFFYLLAINYGWNDAAFRKWGVLFHGIPLLFAFGTAIAAIAMDLIHSANLWCWIGPNLDGQIGRGYNFYRMAFFYGPMWTSFFVVTICLSLVFSFVRNITLKAEANLNHWKSQDLTTAESTPEVEGFVKSNDDELYHDQGFDDSDSNENETASQFSSAADSVVRAEKALKKKNMEILMYTQRRKKVAKQCLRYSVGFYITWIPITCLRILQLMEKPVPYPLLLAAAALAPMQGLPNFVTLVFPRMRKILGMKKEKPEQERKMTPYDAALSKSSSKPIRPKFPTHQGDDDIARSIVKSFKERMMSCSTSTNNSDNLEAAQDKQRRSNYTHPEMYMMMAISQQ